MTSGTEELDGIILMKDGVRLPPDKSNAESSARDGGSDDV